MKFMPHHEAWLLSHPERAPDWFKARMIDGFEVHHVDGDHDNNHPHNLVLIEKIDHMRLHGIFRLNRPHEHMRKIGAIGTANSRKNLGKRKVKQLAKKAANVRWDKRRAIEMKRRARQRAAAHKARKQGNA